MVEEFSYKGYRSFATFKFIGTDSSSANLKGQCHAVNDVQVKNVFKRDSVSGFAQSKTWDKYLEPQLWFLDYGTDRRKK